MLKDTVPAAPSPHHPAEAETAALSHRAPFPHVHLYPGWSIQKAGDPELNWMTLITMEIPAA